MKNWNDMSAWVISPESTSFALNQDNLYSKARELLERWVVRELIWKWKFKKKIERERNWQLKCFKELVVLFVSPAFSGLGNSIGLPHLLPWAISGCWRGGHGLRTLSRLWIHVENWAWKLERERECERQGERSKTCGGLQCVYMWWVIWDRSSTTPISSSCRHDFLV